MTKNEEKKVLYVTDQGSVKIGARLYLPGEEIEVHAFRGREAQLRELIAAGCLARRHPRMRMTEDGTVVKFRSAGAPPLPSELDEYDPKRKRELRPITSEVVKADDIHQQLAELKKEQRAKAAAKEVEKFEPEKAPEKEPEPDPEEDARLDEIVEDLEDQESEQESEVDQLSDEEFFGDLLEEGDEDLEEDDFEEDEVEADLEEAEGRS